MRGYFTEDEMLRADIPRIADPQKQTHSLVHKRLFVVGEEVECAGRRDDLSSLLVYFYF